MHEQVFVNVCFSDSIQSFSQQKKLDDEGKEQEVQTGKHAVYLDMDRHSPLTDLFLSYCRWHQGIHVPLSLGAPHEVKDKTGATSLAFDVAVNSQVVDDCRADKTGSFRNFVCELALEYIDQKVSLTMNFTI